MIKGMNLTYHSRISAESLSKVAKVALRVLLFGFILGSLFCLKANAQMGPMPMPPQGAAIQNLPEVKEPEFEAPTLETALKSLRESVAFLKSSFPISWNFYREIYVKVVPQTQDKHQMALLEKFQADFNAKIEEMNGELTGEIGEFSDLNVYENIKRFINPVKAEDIPFNILFLRQESLESIEKDPVEGAYNPDLMTRATEFDRQVKYHIENIAYQISWIQFIIDRADRGYFEQRLLGNSRKHTRMINTAKTMLEDWKMLTGKMMSLLVDDYANEE